MTYQLGIDLGDANTTAAVLAHGLHGRLHQAAVRRLSVSTSAFLPVVFRRGALVLPSELYVDQQGSVSVGPAVELARETRPDLVVRNFVHRIGDPAALSIDGRAWTAQALAAQLVRCVVDHVTEVEAGPPTRTAVTHPAGWPPDRVTLLEDALLDLGLAVTLVPGPVCAALSWGDALFLEPGAMITVYDLGASKLDIAVLRRTRSGVEIVGNPECRTGLGGNSFDDLLLDWVRGQFAEQFDAVDLADPEATSMIERLRRDCTIAKEALSFDTTVPLPVRLPGFRSEIRLERNELENLIRPTVAQTVAVLRQVITASANGLDKLDKVLLVGGSTGVPLVSELVADVLPRQPARLPGNLNLTAGGAVRALAARPLEPWTPPPDLPAPSGDNPPAGPSFRPDPSDRRWKRSDLIAVGSLVVALLALLYSPGKDFLAERNKKSVVMQVDEIWWSLDGGGSHPTNVACQGDGTTLLPGSWDHLEVRVSITEPRPWRQRRHAGGCLVGGRRGPR